MLTYHFFIGLKRHLEDVSLLSLCEEKEHGLGLVGGRADKYHAALRIIQVILSYVANKQWREGESVNI